jgi:hypothetical protein
VILITHIEPVREGLDRVINVGYDADRGCSVVTESEGDAISISEDRELTADERPSRVRPDVAEETIESTAGAGA